MLWYRTSCLSVPESAQHHAANSLWIFRARTSPTIKKKHFDERDWKSRQRPLTANGKACELFEWKRICTVFVQHLYCRWRSSYQEGKDSINRFNLTTYLCMSCGKAGHGFPTSWFFSMCSVRGLLVLMESLISLFLFSFHNWIRTGT
jgi:hypothetical protein